MNNQINNLIESLKQKKVQDDEILRENYREELNTLKAEDTIAFNAIAEKNFNKGLCSLIEEYNNQLFKKTAINEMAYRLDVSVITIKRYLDKHATKLANFEIKNNLVKCKQHNHGRKLPIKVIKNQK